MSIKRLLFISSIPLVLSSCASFYPSQPPAPVYSGDLSSVIDKPAPVVQQTIPAPEPVTTRPLPQTAVAPVQEIPAEPVIELPKIEPPKETLSIEQQQAMLEQEMTATAPIVQEPALKEPKPAEVAKETPPEEISLPPVVDKPVVEVAPPPPPPPPVFQPLENFPPASPAINSLVLAANKESKNGNLDLAIANVDRAMHIDARNPALLYRMALYRLKQSKLKDAEELANRAISLSGANTELKKHSWLLIARARELQKNTDGAKKARDMADKF